MSGGRSLNERASRERTRRRFAVHAVGVATNLAETSEGVILVRWMTAGQWPTGTDLANRLRVRSREARSFDDLVIDTWTLGRLPDVDGAVLARLTQWAY